MAKLSLCGVQRHYANLQIVHDIDMEIGDEEFIVIAGPSGCDKPTLLCMVADLEPITGDEVWIGDHIVNKLEPAERDIAMVFQSYALYPHMSMFGNMAHGSKIRGLPESDIQARVEQAAGILELGKLLDHKPRQPSGGQRQQVAMGQAIMRKPTMLLFDESLSNLDAKLRVQMRLELKDLHHRSRTTSLYATHDRVKAMTLADRVMMLNGGRVEQIGTPLEVYSRPANTFAAGFIGPPPMNLVPVLHNAGGGIQTRVDGVKESDAAAMLGHLPMGLHLPERALTGLRSEYTEPCSTDETTAFIDVRVVEVLGADTFTYGALAGYPVVVRPEPHASVKAGDELPITASAEHLYWFDPRTMHRIEALA